ncbi:MAG: 50S ribosomal protein L28 [Chloroflexi bacterium]|nr:50S ribosomal protein L28 [Chloroflexota bacterium]
MKCDVCGKTATFGHNVSHSKRRTPRKFSPNVLKHRLMIDGVLMQVSICTRCLRTLQKAQA